MSLADCLKGLKLHEDVVASINKDVSGLVKKGMDLKEAEAKAVGNHIAETKKQIEYVRSNLKGDFAPVDLKVTDSKEFFQSKKTEDIISVSKVVYPVVMGEYGKNATTRIAKKVKSFELVDGVIVSNKSVNKSDSNLRKLQKEEYAHGLTFESSREALTVNFAVIENLDEIFAKSYELRDRKEDKERAGIDLWKYRYSMANVNGKNYLVKFRIWKSGDRATFHYENALGEKGTKGVISSVLGEDNVRASLEGATPSNVPDIILSDFKKIVNLAEEKFGKPEDGSNKKNQYWQNQQDTKRGSVLFSATETIMRLFKAQDKSTFLHESGHIFLQSMYDHVMSGDADSKYMARWSKLAEWLKYDPNQTELTTEQHEQFARGFEAYLMEGKAPSKALQGAFSSFRKWLMRIYKSAASLNVELTPEVRDVMDRMLATEDEIAISKKQMGLDIEIDASDMPAGVKAKIDKLRAQAEEKAIASLMKDQMKEISVENKEFLKSKEKELMTKTKQEVTDSEYGKRINDIALFTDSKDIWKQSQKFLGDKLSDEKKIEFETAAEELGYTSGDHMAKEVLAMKSITETAKELVAEEMKQYSDMTTPENVRAKAMDKIHNEKSTELLAMEKEILRARIMEETTKENDKITAAMEKNDAATLNKWLDAKENFLQKKAYNAGLQKGNEKLQKELSRLSEREGERRAREDQKRLVKEYLAAKDDHERKIKLDEFRSSVNSLSRIIRSYTKSEAMMAKERAHEILASKSLKESTRFTQYFTAERNAAIRVMKAIAINDWQGAMTAKHEQMLNHALSRESMRLKKEMQRHVIYLENVRTASRDSFKTEDHHYQASKILERFGFTRTDYDPTFQGESLAQWEEKYQDTGIVSLPDWIKDESIRIKTKELTIEQMSDVRDAITNIKHVANYEDQLFIISQKENATEVAGGLIVESQMNFNPKDRFKNKFIDTKIDKMKGWMRSYMFSLKKIEAIVGANGAWKDKSKWLEVFRDSSYNAANEESKMVQNATKEIGKNWDIYTDQERKDIYNKMIFIPSFGISLTKEHLLAMAHNLGNEGNRSRLFDTRPVGIDVNVPWGEGMIMQVLQKELTKKDWQFVQANWNHLETYWSKISDLHKRITGFTPKQVEHTKFSVLVGDERIDMAGGYYPLKQDSRDNYGAEIKQNADAALYTDQSPAWKAATKKGHTKERVAAKYPVALNLGILNRHIQEVIHDMAFREVVIDLNKLVARPDMQAEMKATMTPEGYREVKAYIAGLAANSASDPISAIDKVLKVLRKNTTTAALFWKVSVIVQNFANATIFPNAVEGFGYADAFKSYMKYGISDYALKMFSNEGKEIRESVYEKSSFMKDRADSPDYSIEDIHSKFSSNEASEVSKFAGAMMAWTDEFSNLPMWLGAYNKSIAEGKSEKESVHYADTLIMRVAGSSRKYDVAGMSRGTETQKMFGMFFSWINTEHNRWMREAGIFKRDKDVTRALGFLAGRIIFQAIGAGLMFRLPDPTDEEEVKKFLASITIGLPLSFFPGLRDVASAVVDKSMGVKGFGYTPSPAFAAIDYGIKGFGAAIDVAHGKIDGQQAAEKMSKAAAYGFGYPDQMNQWFFNLYDYNQGATPRIQDIYRRREKKERLK
jgi:hypothetical protein